MAGPCDGKIMVVKVPRNLGINLSMKLPQLQTSTN